MTETRFANASGLPDNRHATTARDMAVSSAKPFGAIILSIIIAFRHPPSHGAAALAATTTACSAKSKASMALRLATPRASGFNLATMAERNGRRVIVVVLGGETAAARDAQVAYLVEGAYQEYARREDPNAAQFASLPMRRLDVGLAPGALALTSASPTPLPPSQYGMGSVVETLSPVRAPLDTDQPRATKPKTVRPKKANKSLPQAS